MLSLLLATIVTGEADWADVFFLVAVIVFAVAAFLSRASVAACLVAVGLAFTAAAWLVL